MSSHAEIGLELLSRAWTVQPPAEPTPSSELATLVDAVFQGTETGYKKAVIIQAAGKAADPLLDAQAMQKGKVPLVHGMLVSSPNNRSSNGILMRISHSRIQPTPM